MVVVGNWGAWIKGLSRGGAPRPRVSPTLRASEPLPALVCSHGKRSPPGSANMPNVGAMSPCTSRSGKAYVLPTATSVRCVNSEGCHRLKGSSAWHNCCR